MRILTLKKFLTPLIIAILNKHQQFLLSLTHPVDALSDVLFFLTHQPLFEFGLHLLFEFKLLLNSLLVPLFNYLPH